MPGERGGTASFKNLPNRKKHVCEFCGRDDFSSRQALSYHRLKVCDKRPEEDPPAAADPPGPREELARRLSTMMIPIEPPPEEAAAAAAPPKPPTPAPAAAALPKPAADEGWRDQERPVREERHFMHPTLFFFLLLLIGILALVIMFWDVIEREGKKFLKQFDAPAPEVTDDGGAQPPIPE